MPARTKKMMARIVFLAWALMVSDDTTELARFGVFAIASRANAVLAISPFPSADKALASWRGAAIRPIPSHFHLNCGAPRDRGAKGQSPVFEART